MQSINGLYFCPVPLLQRTVLQIQTGQKIFYVCLAFIKHFMYMFLRMQGSESF